MLEAAYKDTLFVISDEMQITLNDIRAALELAIETKDNKHLLMVQGLLNSARGALEIVGFEASTMLATEMLKLVELLIEKKSVNRQQSLSALSSSVLLLPSFFSKTVESEGKENSLALLPVLQELRAAREAKPLSEDTMMLLDVQSDELADRTVSLPKLAPKQDLRLQIGKYRSVFQANLLGWIKDANSAEPINRLAIITNKYEMAAKTERSFKLWWLTAGIIEALNEGGLKSSPELRRLLGQVDRAGKMILDHGEQYFQENTDRVIINKLLYFITNSSSSGKRVTDIRQAFSLNDTKALEEKIVDAKASLAVPDVAVMRSLSLAIKDDLNKVKDTLDIFNRTGSKENLNIDQHFNSLKKIADTLQMLGLTDLQERVLSQQKEIRGILERNDELTDNHLIGVAASLLKVESRLEEELSKLAGKKGKEKPKYLLDALEATFSETKVNLARLKEVIAQFMRDPTDIKPISRAPMLLKEARAASMMAQKDRLANILDRLQDYITRHLIGSGRLPYAEHLELLAGAIESVDFYLETLTKGRRDPWYMLDNAETCLEQLLREAPQPLPSSYVADNNIDQTVSLPILSDIGDKTVVNMSPNQGTGTVALPVLTPEKFADMQAKNIAVHPDSYPIKDPAIEADPELIEIFIEEANEVQQEISREFGIWKNDQTQRDSLIAVRRGFHTLKGSGRMVGAKRIGEFAWALENLINRTLEGTVTIDDDGMHLLKRSVGVIPDLIEQLETGTENKVDAHQLMLTVESYVEQKLNPAVDVNEITHLPGGITLVQGQSYTDTQQVQALPVNLPDQNPRKAEPKKPVVPVFDENAPQTQIIDMREMIKASTADDKESGNYSQLMEMRKDAQHDSSSAVNEFQSQKQASKTVASSNVSKQSREIIPNKAYYLDEPLYKIYTDESSKHLAVVREFTKDSVGKIITSKMHRAVHTLHGTANMAGLTPIMDLAAEFEHYIQRLYDEGIPIEPEPSESLVQVADQLDSMIASINTGELMPSVPHELIDNLRYYRSQIDDATIVGQYNIEAEPEVAADLDFSVMDDILSEESVAQSETQRFSNSDVTNDQRNSEPLLNISDAAIDAVIPQDKQPEVMLDNDSLLSEDELADIFATPDSPQETVAESNDELIVESMTVNEKDAVDESTDDLLDELELELDDILIATPEISDANPDATDINKAIDYEQTLFAVDSEITEVFLEEAEEIVANVDNAVATWDENGLSLDSMKELQRHLHTIKGGARMAGLLSLGDFTHDQESFVIALTNGVLEQNDDAKKVLQASVDHVHTMLADVKNGQPPRQAQHILDKMVALVEGVYSEPATSIAVDQALTPETELIDSEVDSSVDLVDVQDASGSSLDLSLSSEAAVTLFDGTYSEEKLPEPDEEKAVEVNDLEEKQTEKETVETAAEVTDAGSIFEYTSNVIPVQQRQQDAARISTSNLETLLNQAGEVSIFRSRIEQELSNANLNLAELSRTVNRVKEQLRKMEIETEATILYQHKDETEHSDFDPLEMDRYSNVQQVSRALAESVNDLQSLETILENQFRETEALLLQQSRVMSDLQDNLMRVRMIPFARYAPRYARIVRQIATETGKEVELNVKGAESEIDRQVIERMQAPLEHMIRNAVIHGIEKPNERRSAGKDPEGAIELRLSREGAQLLMEMEDDGAGLDLDGIRKKALSVGLITDGQKLTDTDISQLILNSGLSTSKEVTQSAGRGVGMDVVASEIKQLGGSLQIFTEAGKGTRFLMRLPFTRAINHALLVRAGEESYAIPIHKVDGVAKISLSEVQRLLATDEPIFKYADRDYSVKTLSALVGSLTTAIDSDEQEYSLIMVTGGDHHAALVVNEVIGSREMVIKPVGPQIASIRGISGATILGDGRIVVILDMDALLGVQLHELQTEQVAHTKDTKPLILVVDDSITVRRVTERLLERNNIDVMTARDGLDAIKVLQDILPDLILMDIEMPRMDGYELAEHVRKDERIADVPIIMITSRTGDKHRNRAMEIGVDDYLGKPYREDQLLEAINPHISKKSVN